MIQNLPNSPCMPFHNASLGPFNLLTLVERQKTCAQFPLEETIALKNTITPMERNETLFITMWQFFGRQIFCRNSCTLEVRTEAQQSSTSDMRPRKLKDISILKHFWERTLGGPNKLRTLNRMQTNLNSTLILTQRYVIPGTLLSHPKSRSFSYQTCRRPDPLLWNFGQRIQEPPGLDRDTHRAK